MRCRVLLLAVLVVLSGVAAQDAAAATATARLQAFGSCTSLVRYARHHALRSVVPRLVGVRRDDGRGTAPPAPAPVATPEAGQGGDEDSSATNVQEEGVDEPDLVKTDGRHIFAIAGDALHAIDARAETPRLVGSLALGTASDGQLLRYGSRALIVSSTAVRPPPAIREQAPEQRAGVLLTEVDLSDPAHMRVVRTQVVDGMYVSARLTGATARVVITAAPLALEVPPPDGPVTDEQLRGRYARFVRRAGSVSWRPSSLTRRGRHGPVVRRAAVACSAIRRPAVFSGLDLLTVLTVDLERGLPAVEADAVMTSGETLYASASSLYVATTRWDPDGGTAARTAIHRFDASQPRRTEYRASGEVPGGLLSQWSLSEHNGVLRAASTVDATEQRESESRVTVLQERDGRLAEVGRLEGLGRGERIYAVRFIENVGYVVTFRQTDPLFTIDLATPSAPRLLGELKIPGYSAYLHPIGDGLLLGVGQDADAQGRLGGSQLSIFDVADPRNPVRLHQLALGRWSSSEVEWDHHAFLYWPAAQLAVLPVNAQAEDGPSFAGGIGVRIDRTSGIQEVGRVTHPTGVVQRSVVVGERLFTISQAGVKASSLDRLADLAWMPFE